MTDEGFRIRPYRTSDRAEVAEVCLRTARAGGDATGVYSDDALMPEVFALPYVDRVPEFAFVVVTGAADPHGSAPGAPRAERVVGYVIAAPDTAGFIDWWAAEYAPEFAARHPEPGPPTGADPVFTEAQLLAAGRDPERMRIPEFDEYPAHLHIDLLPEAQGRGLGRRLIDTLLAALDAAGVPAVHLGMDAANTGARAFYDRLGFHELASSTPTAPLLGIPTASRRP